MFVAILPDSPRESFNEMLLRLEMTEEEYFAYAKRQEQEEIEAYM